MDQACDLGRTPFNSLDMITVKRQPHFSNHVCHWLEEQHLQQLEFNNPGHPIVLVPQWTLTILDSKSKMWHLQLLELRGAHGSAVGAPQSCRALISVVGLEPGELCIAGFVGVSLSSSVEVKWSWPLQAGVCFARVRVPGQLNSSFSSPVRSMISVTRSVDESNKV